MIKMVYTKGKYRERGNCFMYNRFLKTFLCVADYGSLKKAAEHLFLTPTAVMKQMNALEKQLDLKLFQRTNHGFTLTECGASVYKDAKFMIAYSQKAIEKARNIQERQNQTIRVGTSMLNPCKVFMDIWYHVNDQFPQFKIEVVPFEDDHQGILSVIERIGKEFDFIVGVCDSSQWLDRCRMYQLGTYRKCVAVPRGHRLSDRKELTLSDLYGETLMMVKRGDSPVNDSIRNDLEQNHPQIHIEDTENFYDIQVFNRCEQTGSILLNIECWKDIHPSLVTIPVDWNYTIPYGILYALKPSQKTRDFIGAVQAYFAQEMKRVL